MTYLLGVTVTMPGVAKYFTLEHKNVGTLDAYLSISRPENGKSGEYEGYTFTTLQICDHTTDNCTNYLNQDYGYLQVSNFVGIDNLFSEVYLVKKPNNSFMTESDLNECMYTDPNTEKRIFYP